MQTTLQTLTARVAEAARRHFAAYLPWSALGGIGPAGELAARHPAFAPVRRGTERRA